jgi:hypothetical protein
VQTLGVAVEAGETDGVAVGDVDAVGLVDVPGRAQAERTDVAAATARRPGAVVRIRVIRTAGSKGAEECLRCASDCEHISQDESMKFGVVLPGGTATQQLEQAIEPCAGDRSG